MEGNNNASSVFYWLSIGTENEINDYEFVNRVYVGGERGEIHSRLLWAEFIQNEKTTDKFPLEFMGVCLDELCSLAIIEDNVPSQKSLYLALSKFESNRMGLCDRQSAEMGSRTEVKNRKYIRRKWVHEKGIEERNKEDNEQGEYEGYMQVMNAATYQLIRQANADQEQEVSRKRNRGRSGSRLASSKARGNLPQWIILHFREALFGSRTDPGTHRKRIFDAKYVAVFCVFTIC